MVRRSKVTLRDVLRRINVNNSKETSIKMYNKNSKPISLNTMLRVLKK